ncbi:MAG: septal ring lytic transglycosylase RlpA family protein [Xanthobacteraceae bacterium]|nr:septal ring lytic transglycosylase RlpA family protein [Xanthobacteraceae bacterium]
MLVRFVLVAAGSLALANCASSGKFGAQLDPKYGVATSPRVVEDGEPVPKGGGVYRVGKPYQVAGRTYVPEENPRYRAEGLASWYGDDFHGRLTANGEVFDQDAITAAHPTLPIPSYVRVTNVSSRRSIIVRVNDRGPYHGDRVIDLSKKSADLLGFRANGIARVRVEYVGAAPLEGSDDRKLLATLRHDGRPAPAPSGVLLASSAPFVPDVARPIPASRGQIPSPPKRSFEMGRYSSPSDRRRPAQPMAVAEASYAPGAYGPGRAVPGTPIAGYATAVLSGRGLY